jgi:hypothetical protein
MFKLTDFIVEASGQAFVVYHAENASSGPIATFKRVEDAAHYVRALVDERL